jgi:putative DNA-binding protein
MSNRPLAYVLSERKANLGKMAGKIVIQARPTGHMLTHEDVYGIYTN